MSLFKKILTILGIKRNTLEDDTVKLKKELVILHELQQKSLLPYGRAEDISPAVVLNHTGKLKELISSICQNDGFCKDETKINYVLNNISEQERMIELSGTAYSVDFPIYSSQVGASIGEILKDVALLMN